MPLLDLINRERLAQPVIDELEQQNAALRGYLYEQHDDEGGHTDVTANNVTIREGGALTFAQDGSHIDVEPIGDGSPPSQALHLLSASGRIRVEARRYGGAYTGTALMHGPTTIALDWETAVGNAPAEAEGLDNLNPAFATQILRLFPQTVISNGPPRETSFGANVRGAAYSVYRVTAPLTNSIEGISVWDFLPPYQRGQVVVIINGRANPLYVGAGVVTNPQRIYGGVTLAPNGAAMLVYDVNNAGWQIISAAGTMDGVWQTFTPGWFSTGTQPTGGVFSGVRYSRVGKTIHGTFTMAVDGSTTFGTGSYRWSIPVTAAAAGPLCGTALLFDAGTNFRVGAVYLASTGAIGVVADSAVNVASPTTPFTWAAGDYMRVTFTYEAA